MQGLAALVGELAAERAKVDALRSLSRAQHPRVKAVIGQLRNDVRRWSRASLEGDLQLTESALLGLGRRLDANPPLVAGFEARRALLREIVVARREARAAPAVAQAVAQTLTEVEAAQDQLMAAFTANPNWTAEERAKAARINRARIAGALKSLAALAAGAF